MQIKLDVKDCTMVIEKQEGREEQEVMLDNRVKISICSYPDCAFYNDGSVRCIFLRGDSPSRDFRTIDFRTFPNLVNAYMSIKKFCAYKNWTFNSNINIERFKIS